MPVGWEKQPRSAPQPGSRVPVPPERPRDAAPTPQASPELTRAETFVAVRPVRRLGDLVVPTQVFAQIEGALDRIRHHRTLYEEWDLGSIDPSGARVAVNLFGLPGTGKSFCAEAIAERLGKLIIRVNYAEIESKYVGETPKNIVAAFQRARETDAVLFFDEADSILGKRLTSVTQSADHGVNVSRSVMLLQLDAFEGVVIFATNLARNYDPAFVRRILAHVEFVLPDLECRHRLWMHYLRAKLPRSPDVEPAWLAAQSEGLSGGTLLNVIVQAATRAVVRSDVSRRITREDVLVEIERARNAIRQVGAPAEPAQRFSRSTVVPYDQLPDDVQADLLARMPAGAPVDAEKPAA
jgi:SpoVK/Ycf46/Vps4 family AAA+-type ATPase